MYRTRARNWYRYRCGETKGSNLEVTLNPSITEMRKPEAKNRYGNAALHALSPEAPPLHRAAVEAFFRGALLRIR